MKYLLLIIFSPLVVLARVEISNDMIESVRKEKRESHRKLKDFFASEVQEEVEPMKVLLPFEPKVSASRVEDQNQSWKLKDKKTSERIRKNMNRIAEELNQVQ